MTPAQSAPGGATPSGGQASPAASADKPPENPGNPAAPLATPQGTVVGSSGSLGAFHGAPEQAKTSTVGLQLNGGAAKKQAAPEIPKDVQWQPPTVLQQAKTPTAGAERAVVTYVGDGDSAQLKRKDGSSVNCRIDTIDAPEVAHPNAVPPKPGQPFGEEAKRTLASMIENREVTLRITRPAQAGKNYGRALCQIEVEGVGVDKEMLRRGAAWLYRRYVNSPELDRLEQQARASKTGLWADPAPVNPETFRHSQ